MTSHTDGKSIAKVTVYVSLFVTKLGAIRTQHNTTLGDFSNAALHFVKNLRKQNQIML